MLPVKPAPPPVWPGQGQCSIDPDGGGIWVSTTLLAEGDLAKHPSVLLSVLDSDGQAALAACLRSKVTLASTFVKKHKRCSASKVVEVGTGVARRSADCTELVQAFDSISKGSTVLTLFGAHRAELYENCKGNVWGRYAIGPAGLRKTLEAAKLTEEQARTAVDLMSTTSRQP